MRLLIPEITQTIVSALRENVKTVAKTNITTDDETSGKGKTLPRISIASPDFTVEEFGLAGSEPEKKELQEDKFSGDGKQSEFILSREPLRPLLSVEHPLGEGCREPDDYSVDYLSAKITFRTPPAKGKGNVLVRYNGAKSSGELRSLQLNLKYLLKVNADRNSQRDEITLEVLRALVLAKDSLEKQGVLFKILGGHSDSVDHESPSRNIECLAQTKLLVEMPSAAMEKILIEKKERFP